MEPTSFTVKEDSQYKGGESEFVKTKLMTRLTYTLDGMSGTVKVCARACVCASLAAVRVLPQCGVGGACVVLLRAECAAAHTARP
jgi:hypothetical protein